MSNIGHQVWDLSNGAAWYVNVFGLDLVMLVYEGDMVYLVCYFGDLFGYCEDILVIYLVIVKIFGDLLVVVKIFGDWNDIPLWNRFILNLFETRVEPVPFRSGLEQVFRMGLDRISSCRTSVEWTGFCMNLLEQV